MNILLTDYVRTGDADLLPECNTQAALPYAYATGGSTNGLWLPSNTVRTPNQGQHKAAYYTAATWRYEY